MAATRADRRGKGQPALHILGHRDSFAGTGGYFFSGLGGGGAWRFGFAGLTFFGGRSTITLPEIGENDGENELFLAVVVELNRDVFFIAYLHGTETELHMLDLGARGEGRFCRHIR